MNLNLSTPKKQAGFIAEAFALGSAAVSIFKGNEARKSQNEARQAQQQINALKNIQAFRVYMNRFRLANATAKAQALIGGAQDSSFAQATQASQQAQARVAGGEFGKMTQLGGEASSALNAAANANMVAGIASQVSQFAQSDQGGAFFENVEDIFNKG